MKKKVLLLAVLVNVSVLSIGECYSQILHNGYHAYVDLELGDAYNFNTDQKISTNNMQLYCMISITHGCQIENWFVGGGIGYYHSFRDKENIYPIYATGRYTFSKKLSPYIETRVGIVYDPKWISKVQVYGALSGGVSMYKRLQIGLRLTVFSRPSRYFTANATVMLSYMFGR